MNKCFVYFLIFKHALGFGEGMATVLEQNEQEEKKEADFALC